MPHENQKIVTGMREPQHDGQITKPMVDIPPDSIRRQKLMDGQVEFHSLNRRYRVEFQKPKQQMNQATGEIIEEGPRFLQFDGRRCVTDNLNLVHQAKGCHNIGVGTMVYHEHTPYCVVGCKISRCFLGHQNPKNPTQLYYPKHPSYGIKGDFWDSTEMDVMVAKDAKTRLISDMKKLTETVQAEDMPEFLAAIGIDGFNLPPKEPVKVEPAKVVK
jgi:hypothetical protein